MLRGAEPTTTVRTMQSSVGVLQKLCPKVDDRGDHERGDGEGAQHDHDAELSNEAVDALAVSVKRPVEHHRRGVRDEEDANKSGESRAEGGDHAEERLQELGADRRRAAVVVDELCVQESELPQPRHYRRDGGDTACPLEKVVELALTDLDHAETQGRLDILLVDVDHCACDVQRTPRRVAGAPPFEKKKLTAL